MSAICIRRPVMTILVMASFIIAGLFGYKQLPVAAVPRVDFPTIQVTAQLPGASPETMAASVASILERQFSTIAGVTTMTSTSSLGNTSIVLQFDLNRSIDGAALDVQSAISSAMRRLPAELPTPPSFRKVNPADYAIMFLALKLLAGAAVGHRCLRQPLDPAAHLDPAGHGAGADLRHARNTPCACAPTSTSSQFAVSP